MTINSRLRDGSASVFSAHLFCVDAARSEVIVRDSNNLRYDVSKQ